MISAENKISFYIKLSVYAKEKESIRIHMCGIKEK